MLSEPRLGGTATDIAVRGGAIRIETLGSGPPLMLLHGWTLDRRMWLPQVHALAKHHRVIAIDRRGFGQSSAPPDLGQESVDLLAIADTLGLDRFALLGMSQGARVALAFAVQHPARLSALIVQGAPLSGVPGDDGDLPINQMAVLAVAGELQTLRYLWRHHPLMQVEGLAPNAIIDHIVADYAARDLSAPARPLQIGEADLAGISTPTLVVTGANEPAWRHRVAGVIARTLGAERLNIADAGHLANLELPEFRKRIGMHIAALNHAVSNIAPEQLRMHLCWGNYPGRHHCDVPLADIIDIVWTAKPATILFEAANPRHAHEFTLFEEIGVPEGKILCPGVIEPQPTYIEHPELITQRLTRYADLVGADRVIGGVDCGFSIHVGSGGLDPEVVWAKLAALAQGAEIAGKRG